MVIVALNSSLAGSHRPEFSVFSLEPSDHCMQESEELTGSCCMQVYLDFVGSAEVLCVSPP